jgi:hypothetical protein
MAGYPEFTETNSLAKAMRSMEVWEYPVPPKEPEVGELTQQMREKLNGKLLIKAK